MKKRVEYQVKIVYIKKKERKSCRSSNIHDDIIVQYLIIKNENEMVIGEKSGGTRSKTLVHHAYAKGT